MGGYYGWHVPHLELWEVAMGDAFPIPSYGRSLWATRSSFGAMRGRYGQHIPHLELWEVVVGNTFPIASYARLLWVTHSPSRAFVPCIEFYRIYLCFIILLVIQNQSRKCLSSILFPRIPIIWVLCFLDS